MRTLSEAQAHELTRRMNALTPEQRAAGFKRGFEKFNTPEGRAQLQAVYDKIKNPDVRKAFLAGGDGKMAELVKG